MNKSYVTMEAKVCPVCGKEWKTDAILLDRRLRECFEASTVTGYDLCKDCQKLYDDGYVALVEARDDSPDKLTSKIHEPHRTGRIMHMRFEAAKRIPTVSLERDGKVLPMAFISKEAFDTIHARAVADGALEGTEEP